MYNEFDKSVNPIPDEREEPIVSDPANEPTAEEPIINEPVIDEPHPQPTYVWNPDGFETDTVNRPIYNECVKKEKKHRSGFRRFMTAALALVFVASLGFGAGVTLSSKSNIKLNLSQHSRPTDNTAITNYIPSSHGTLSVVDIAKKAGPAVVGVINTQRVMTFFGSHAEQQGGGSGIIISEDGYVITNAHVVENSTNLTVVLNAGTKEYPATLVGADAKTDLAVIKIEETNLPTIEIGKSSELEVGEIAVAIGNPLGQEFAGSVTVGYISALNRAVNIQNRQYNLIQTDAAINPGNSGGALLNDHGQLVGINSIKINAGGYEGMGFAIPIDEAMPIIEELISGDGYIKDRPVIGINPREINEQMSQMYDLPVGIYVIEVSPFSAAELAGIRTGDVIIKADGEPVLTVQELNRLRDKHKAGEEMVLDIVRDRANISITVILGEEKPATNVPMR